MADVVYESVTEGLVVADVVYESVTEALVVAERRGRDRGGQNSAEGAVVRGPSATGIQCLR